MVGEEGMPVEKWAEAWWKMPRDIIKLESIGSFGSMGPLESGGAAATLNDLVGKTTVVIGDERAVDVNAFASLSRNCPYAGLKFKCWPALKP